MTGAPSLLHVTDLSVRLPAGADREYAIRDVNLSVAPNEIVAIMGRNGMGKTTLMKALMGILPAKSGSRRRELEAIRASTSTEIFYEAPHRLKETLEEIVAVLGSTRPIVIARELTKIHEEFLRGEAGSVLQMIKNRQIAKGEITLLIGPAGAENRRADPRRGPARRVAEQRGARGIPAGRRNRNRHGGRWRRHVPGP